MISTAILANSCLHGSRVQHIPLLSPTENVESSSCFSKNTQQH